MLAFPLHLALMTDRSFPFPAVGLVHVANRIVQHRPLQLGRDARFSSLYHDPLQAHPRGRTFALVSEARVGDELVWEDHSTMLRRGAKGSSEQEGGEEPVPKDARSESDAAGGDAGAYAPEAGADADATRPEPPPRGAVWRLPGDLGRRYAAVSGDRNPIHMHALSAKAFGFPRAIAHGMWTQARCLAALEQRLPERFSVAVDFRKPILLPGEVAFGEAEDERGIHFAVTRNGKRRSRDQASGRPRRAARRQHAARHPAATHKEREESP